MALSQKAAQLGKAGEDATAKYLNSQGLEILSRNWLIKEGELDLIATDSDGQIIFVEVKTRSSDSFGDPLESISQEKLRRLHRLALAWLATHQLLGAKFRIDVAGVLLGRSGELSIDYRKGV